MAFDIAKALSDGHSASDVVDYLAKDSKFDVDQARKDGHSDQDILNHLRPPKQEKESFEEINTEDNDRVIYISNIELDGDKFRGITRRLGILFKRNKTEKNK